MARVFVGLSGGVDSAVSAALLRDEGHEVVGVFIKIWQPEFLECTWREDRLDAMRVAAYLDIEFREIDFSAVYEREVVQGMIADYRAGVTPNPDVLCNMHIKFGAFAAWAYEHGAEIVATGHYARSEGGRLLRGVDANKDQSYFLHKLRSEDLLRVRFPIGAMKKDAVRARARRLGLPVAAKHDSQGLCFVGDVTMKDFLSRFIDCRSGAVLNTDGSVVGDHDGAALYTIGQRHGFRLKDPRVMYVVAIDSLANTITVAADRSQAMRGRVPLTDTHWINEPYFDVELHGQARYRETPVPVRVIEQGSARYAHFAEPQLAAAGQSLVLYRGDECVGGGTIG